MVARLIRIVDRNGLAALGFGLLAMGIFAVVLALFTGATRSSQSRPKLCPGQSVVFSSWTASLGAIQPRAGEGYTALEAQMSARWLDQADANLRPQLRVYTDAERAESGAAGLARWNGEFSVQPVSYNRATGCMLLELRWRALRNWLGYGTLLTGIGLMLIVARRVASAATASKLSINVSFGVIMLGLAAMAYWLLRTPEPSSVKPFAGGPALIAVRNQLLHPGRPTQNRWLIIADALTRHGQYAQAAGVIPGAVQLDPNDTEAWLALGDALYSAGGSELSPAAVLAYDRAERSAAQSHVGPGLMDRAMTLSGRGSLAGQW